MGEVLFIGQKHCPPLHFAMVLVYFNKYATVHRPLGGIRVSLPTWKMWSCPHRSQPCSTKGHVRGMFVLFKYQLININKYQISMRVDKIWKVFLGRNVCKCRFRPKCRHETVPSIYLSSGNHCFQIFPFFISAIAPLVLILGSYLVIWYRLRVSFNYQREIG